MALTGLRNPSFFKIISVLFLLATIQTTQGMEPLLKTQCLGPTDAHFGVIYLHGLDTEPSGPGEQSTAIALQKLAETFHLRVALPRSEDPCPPRAVARYGAGTVCWENPDFEKTISRVLASSEGCFSMSLPFGVIGFSTGGHLVNQWILNNPKFPRTPAFWMPIATHREYPLNPTLQAFIQASRPRVSFLIEARHLSDLSNPLPAWLSNHGAKAQFYPYEGGHYFPPDTVYQALLHLLGTDF
jgi:hypothetical protein